MWILVYVALYTEGLDISTWGKFNTQEACIYEMRAAEIGVSFTNEGMMCLEVPGEQIEEFRKQHPDIDIVEYPATTGSDYDDTVAMIAAMDMIVTMQTTTVHVAGGLGIPSWTFVPSTSQWRYGQEGEDFPWAKSVRIIRQNTDGEWGDVMEKTGEELANHPRISKAATGATRKQKNKLRHNSKQVRRNHRADVRDNGGRPAA